MTGHNQDKVPAPTDGSITSFLFPTQADFDVSYVNVADVAAAMGPVSNDQAGYVGSTSPNLSEAPGQAATRCRANSAAGLVARFCRSVSP